MNRHNTVPEKNLGMKKEIDRAYAQSYDFIYIFFISTDMKCVDEMTDVSIILFNGVQLCSVDC